MRYNLTAIMAKAWELRKAKGYTISTALKLAWAAAKGIKLYTFALEAERGAISAYIMKLGKQLRTGLDDIHALHKYDTLRAALMAGVDALGIAVMDGKSVGLCKYAIRNAA